MRVAHLSVVDLEEVAAWREQRRCHAEGNEAMYACGHEIKVVINRGA